LVSQFAFWPAASFDAMCKARAKVSSHRTHTNLYLSPSMATPPMSEHRPSQFYTGLVAELYEPLMSARARAEDYARFVERCGAPVLELGCGSGIPLLDLLALGFEVDGLDSSADMLARCRQQAQARGLSVTLYEQTMQDMELPRRYRGMFLAGGTFTLLAHDEAPRALARMFEHLLPGGRVLIPLVIPDLEQRRRAVGRFREAHAEDGTLLRFADVAFELDAEHRVVHSRMRYERVRAGCAPEVLERDGRSSYWDQHEFADMLAEAGFTAIRAADPAGGAPSPDAKLFVFLARKPE
jgi:SAM-dependent methyltransferase